MSVAEYMQKFDELKTRSQIIEDSRQTLSRFKAGLRNQEGVTTSTPIQLGTCLSGCIGHGGVHGIFIQQKNRSCTSRICS